MAVKSDIVYSHPDKPLRDHLVNTAKIASSLFESSGGIRCDYDFEVLKDIIGMICLSHDFGKATTFFQDKLNGRSNHKTKSSHAPLSAVACYNWIMRRYNNMKLALIGFLVVHYHHGNLPDILDKEHPQFYLDNNLLSEQIEHLNTEYLNREVDSEINHDLFDLKSMDNLNFRKALKQIQWDENDYLLISYLFSLLISSDKAEVIFSSGGRDFNEKPERVDLNPESVDRYKKERFQDSKNIDEVRNRLYETAQSVLESHSDQSFFCLNIPTGTGKTLNGLNLALRLKKKMNRNSRIIYALPFTSIIDQNFDIINQVLKPEKESILLKHHYLSHRKFDEEDDYDFNMAEYMIESWESEMIVTSFVQLLESMVSNRNRKLKKICRLQNAIIILDEVQAIPAEYLSLLKYVMQIYAKHFGCKFIVVTATLPVIFDQNEYIELIPEKEKIFDSMNRIKLINHPELMNLDDFFPIAISHIEENPTKSFLFILNTINSSISFYQQIQEAFPNHDIYYLSGNVIPKHRLERIRQIKSDSERPKIVISTQVVEAGVDIDLDIVYRDIAPLDSIFQAAGRCNRNQVKEKGEVHLIRLVDDGKPYAGYVYDSKVLLKATEESLNNKMGIDESEFFKLAQSYYQTVKTRMGESDSRKLIDHLTHCRFASLNKEFQLIPSEFKTVDVFVETDKDAKEIHEKFKRIQLIEDRYERKEAMSQIRGELFQYIIHVPKSSFGESVDDEFIQFITEEELTTRYDEQTGYIRGHNTKDYSF